MEIESFFQTLGTMEYAQDDELRIALTSRQPPALTSARIPVRLRTCSAGSLARTIGRASIWANRFSRADSASWPRTAWRSLGAGRDVFEGNDECHFISRKAEDHFELSASLTPPVDSHTYAKAGLMYRTGLNADAPIVIVCLNPDGTCTFAYRRKAGARITENRMAPAGQTRTLRLVRDGTRFEATALDGDGKPLATQSADLPDLAAAKGNVGLFVLSHEAMLLSKATFTDIRFH